MAGPSGSTAAPAPQDARSLTRRILALAVPAFGALIAEPLFLLADTAIIGHLGTAQLAGAGVTPGRVVRAEAARDAGYIRVEGEAEDGAAADGGALELAEATAAHVWVERLDG